METLKCLPHLAPTSALAGARQTFVLRLIMGEKPQIKRLEPDRPQAQESRASADVSNISTSDREPAGKKQKQPKNATSWSFYLKGRWHT